MGWKKKSAIIAGILIILYTLAGFLIIPLAAESVLPDKLSRQLNRPTTIRNISFNPYTLTLSLDGLEILEKSGDKKFISFEKLFVNIQWVSLFKMALVTKEFQLENPLIRIVRVSESGFNFSDLIPSEKKEAEAETEEKKDEEPFLFSFSNMTLSDGTIIFRDKPMDKSHRFSDINFTLPRLSNFKENISNFAKPVLAGDFNETKLHFDASTKPFADSLETKLDISLLDISLPGYFDYVPVPLGFSVSSGTLDLKSSIAFRKENNGNSRIEVSGNLDFSNLVLVDTYKEEILSVPSINIKIAPSKPLQKDIRIDSVALTKPELILIRRSSGELNLSQLGLLKEKNPENIQEKTKKKSEKKTDPESSPFVFRLENFLLDSGTVRFKDFAVPSASKGPQAGPAEINMEEMTLEISDFSNQAGQKADIDFSANLNPEASVSAAGNFGVKPIAADMGVDIKNLDLSRAQPYFPESLNLILSDGSLNLSGKARFRSDAGSGKKAQYTGNMKISNFTLIEEKTARTLTEWRSFDVNGINFSSAPSNISLDKLAVSGLRQNIVVEEDGDLNLGNIYEEKESSGNKKQKESEQNKNEKGREKSGNEDRAAFPISIGEVELKDFALSFTDYAIKPHYSSKIILDKGSIKGLSTKAFKGARVSMKGSVDKYAPFEVAGRINPLLEDLLLEMRFDLRNLELPSFSAYSGKYIGRKIEKGKLNLNLDYEVKNKKLEAKNNMLLDKFNLGARVESEDAVSLPVGLAVALLKDRNGQIDLDLPVSGRLDDPQFSLAGIILQMLKNIVVKAAASPFSLVSSIVSGGEELRYIEFQAGLANISDSAGKKLESIQKLLYERPELNIELTGYVDPAKDRQALVDKQLERKILTARLSGKKDKEAAEIEDVDLSPEELVQYLREVYKKEVLSEPDVAENVKQLSDENLTAEYMKEKIRRNIKVTDSKLRLLAQKRVKTVKNYILQDKRLSGKRLFLVEAESLSPPESGEFKSSRVELDLR